MAVTVKSIAKITCSKSSKSEFRSDEEIQITANSEKQAQNVAQITVDKDNNKTYKMPPDESYKKF